MAERVRDDAWQSTLAGRHLSGRKKTDTVPELLLRRALHAAGGRYRLHVRLAQGCTPDLLMPSRKLAVFVDGCFWHSCPTHGRKTPFTGPNAERWALKMQRNRERDLKATQVATDLGWQVFRFWECQVRADAPALAATLLGQEAGGLLP